MKMADIKENLIKCPECSSDDIRIELPVSLILEQEPSGKLSAITPPLVENTIKKSDYLVLCNECESDFYVGGGTVIDRADF